jgi:hypothetical protein
LAVPFQHPHDGSFVLTASFGNAATVLVAVQLQVNLTRQRQFTSTAVVMIKQLFGARSDVTNYLIEASHKMGE